MGQFTITLSDDLEYEIRQKVKDGKYGSVSDFARDAFRAELTNQPSYWERFIAAHVLENNKILKTITKDTNWGSDELLAALQRGYVGDYSRAEEIVYSDVLTVEGSEFVHAVLGMYTELQLGYDKSDSTDEGLAKKVLFEGFDGNAGDGYLGYVNFLVDNGRYNYIRPLNKIPHLNSHSPVNDVYRRMLNVFNGIKAKREPYEFKPLSISQVEQILAARVHPEFR